jgi:hypothetical protein
MISHALVARDACARGSGAIIAPGIWPVLRNEPYGKTQLENVRSKVQGCAVSCPAGIKSHALTEFWWQTIWCRNQISMGGVAQIQYCRTICSDIGTVDI